MDDPSGAITQLAEERSTLGWVLFFNIGDGISPVVLLLKLLVVFIAELTAGYFIASLCGLFLDFKHIKSSPAGLFVLIGSAGFIKGLLVAFALISAAVPGAGLGLLAPFALLLVLGLQLGYLTRSLMRLCGLNAGKALTAWLFAFVPVLVAVGLLTVFLVWGIALLF